MTRSRRLIRAGLAPAALAILALCGIAFAAEGVRLTPQPAIYVDAAGGGLQRPEDVAVGAGGSRLVVADTGNGRLMPYAIDGETLTAQPEIRLTQLPYPIRVAVTSKGDTLALDGRLRKVARISSSGEFVSYVEPSGDTASGPTTPRAIALDGGDNLHLLDIFHARVLVLDGDGRILRSVALPRGRHSFSDIAVGAAGEIYAIESVERRVYVAKKGDEAFSALTGSLKEEMAFPTAIAADGRGHLFVADQTGGGIVVLGADGSFLGRQSGRGWTRGLLRYPSGLCVADGGLLFVADRENDRVSVFIIAH